MAAPSPRSGLPLFVRRVLTLAVVAGVLAGLIALYRATRPPPTEGWLGYAEADYVKVGPTQSGLLTRLMVKRGDEVSAGTALFTQDDIADAAACAQAEAELEQARHRLRDLNDTSRDQEIRQATEDLEAQRAAQDRASRDLDRAKTLFAKGWSTTKEIDLLSTDARAAEARVKSAEAKLTLMKQSTGRTAAIAAQQASVAAAEAAAEQAKWRYDQRHVEAPVTARVADTFAQPGETMTAGAPVVSLLPPENIFVRFFVPETVLANMRRGAPVRIKCDSCPPGLDAQISFVATQSEYTPPVIYSQGTRGSLVYLIEARPPVNKAPYLKPGQPVEVAPLFPTALQ